MAKVTTLYEDSAKTEALYPRTKVSAVSDANNNSLETILESLQNRDIITSSLVTVSSSISANNLYVYRCGRVVLLSGYITNSSDVGAFTSFFTIPEGYRPSANVSISPINQDTTAWLFITSTDGVCSPQNMNLASGTRYFTAMWIA